MSRTAVLYLCFTYRFIKARHLMIAEDGLSLACAFKIRLDLSNTSVFCGSYIREMWLNRDRECRDINCTGRY